MLHFLFELNQRGLMDPDSGTQNWDNIVTKLSTKRVLLMWYSWQRGFYNTSDRANNNDAYIFAPVNDLTTCNNSDNYYGSERSFSIGAQVDDEKFARIMEFLDWYAGPEGCTYEHAGLPGFNYTVNEDGTYTRTVEGENALMQNLTVPDEFGGGGFQDGNNAINQWIVEGISVNPVTGESYVPDYWATTILKNQTTMTKEWTERYGAENQVKYLLEKGMLAIIPSVSVSLVSDSTDIGLIRSQCGQLVKNTSWQMVFAKDQAEFDAMWQDLKVQLDGFGYQELVAFDMEKYQPLVDARLAAME
jgi:multiple sugar transport system substrate-binding protein/putative aldouronate transport system substrate-binding protein